MQLSKLIDFETTYFLNGLSMNWLSFPRRGVKIKVIAKSVCAWVAWKSLYHLVLVILLVHFAIL